MASPYAPSILIDAVIEALAAFVQPFVGSGTPIIRGQQNRVPPPITAFVKLQELLQSPLGTPVFTQDSNPDNQYASIQTAIRIDVQIDFYGPSAGDWSTAIETVFRSLYAPSQFPDGMTSLYCSDGHLVPLVTGEEQYENRWALTATLEYNPSVTVPQQSATALAVNIFEDIP